MQRPLFFIRSKTIQRQTCNVFREVSTLLGSRDSIGTDREVEEAFPQRKVKRARLINLTKNPLYQDGLTKVTMDAHQPRGSGSK